MDKRAIIALLAGIVALATVNISIYNKENLLQDGEIILLQLAPVDPRSLMQGDYMALRFRIGNDIRTNLQKQEKGKALQQQDGYIIAAKEDNGVCNFVRLDDRQQLGENERKIKFRIRNGQVKFATNAFFFQEGTANLYSKARFGEFRLAASGELLLTGLRNESFKQLGPGQPVTK